MHGDWFIFWFFFWQQSELSVGGIVQKKRVVDAEPDEFTNTRAPE